MVSLFGDLDSRDLFETKYYLVSLTYLISMWQKIIIISDQNEKKVLGKDLGAEAETVQSLLETDVFTARTVVRGMACVEEV